MISIGSVPTHNQSCCQLGLTSSIGLTTSQMTFVTTWEHIKYTSIHPRVFPHIELLGGGDKIGI